MTSQQPTSIQNIPELPDTLKFTSLTSTIIAKIPAGLQQPQEPHQSSESEPEQELKQEQIEGKKKTKNKKKKKNSVPIQAIPINNQPSQNQPDINPKIQPHITSKQEVVKHKIVEIKRNIFTECSSSSVSINTGDEDESKKIPAKIKDSKGEELNDKQMKAISSVFGQFFKVQNLKNYQKMKTPATEVKLAQNLPKTVRVIKSVKPLSDLKSVQLMSSTQTVESIEISSSNKPSFESIQDIKPAEVQKAEKEEGQILYTRISNGRSASCKKLSEPICEEILFVAPQRRQSYDEPEFQLIQPAEPYKMDRSHLNKELTSSPLIQKSVDSISFDEETPVSPQTFENFMNNNQFKHPLLECESRGSFPMEEMKPHSYAGDTPTISNLKEVRSIEMVASRKLTNLKLNQNNARFCESHEFQSEDIAQTPFFQLKKRDSEFQLIGDVRIRNIEESPSKKLQKTHSEANHFHPKENISYSHVSEVIKETQKDTLDLSEQSKISQTSQVQPKRLNNFLPIDEEMSNIERIFKDFNRENKMMIDVLSYNAGFETFEEVSSNLVNEMEKCQEDEFINELLTKNQNEWRMKLFGVETEVLTPSKQVNLYSCKKISQYQINRPSPTKNCSPSKYIYMSSYKPKLEIPEPFVKTEEKIETFEINKKEPLRLPTFSHNSFPSHAQIDYEINDDSFYRKENQSSRNQNQSASSNENDQKQAYFGQRNYGNDQKEEIREFYNYLQSKQPKYQVKEDNQSSEQSNNSLSAKNFDNLCYRYERTANNQRKIIPTFQNLHETKETSKPILPQNSSREFQSANQEDQIAQPQEKNMLPYISSLAPKNLEILAMNFRKENPVGGHTNTGDDIVSLAGSLEHEQHESKRFPETVMYQSFKINDTETNKIPKLSIPIHPIEPIKVTSKSKSKKKNSYEKVSHVPLKKMKVISANPPAKSQTSIEMPKVLVPPPQMTGFLMTPTHLGTMMLNNVFKNYILPQAPVQVVSQQQQQPVNQNPDSKILIKSQPESGKKKITISTKLQGSSSKKISINQKTISTARTETDLLNKNSTETASQKIMGRINPQLQQTISRINQKTQNELRQLIKSRITERSNSRESSRYQSSNLKNVKDESKMVENDSILSNYQVGSGYSKQKGKNNKNYSNSKEKPYNKSRNSSRSSKKSGLQLWNEGLSELKQSRRQNGSKSPKIFKQKSQRENQKVIGITRWNQNLSKLKQSRSKSRQSNLSFTRPSYFGEANRKENQSKLTSSSGFGITQMQQQMNIEIKKHKYQVNNVQKRYL